MQILARRAEAGSGEERARRLGVFVDVREQATRPRAVHRPQPIEAEVALPPNNLGAESETTYVR